MSEPSADPRIAMSIAGSDSGGGAGLQADLKTFAALGVFGTFAITAVTAQNTETVSFAASMEPGLVRMQIETVMADMSVAAVKTGMLATPEIVSVVADLARAGLLRNLVVDPVLVSTTGRRLLDDDAVPVYLEKLFPYAEVVTPNLREARLLADMAIPDVDAMIAAARRIAEFGPKTVVVKGGHLESDVSPDVILRDGSVEVVEAPRVPTTNDHGTGCTLSAATTAYIARGEPPVEALKMAKCFVTKAITGSARWRLGSGHGPLDQMGWGLQDH